MMVNKRKVTAAEEPEVESENTSMLFEAEDVAELLAEVTGEAVDFEEDGENIVFTVAEDEYVVSPDGNEELVESSTRVLKKAVAASNKPAARKSVAASTQGKAVRKIRK